MGNTKYEGNVRGQGLQYFDLEWPLCLSKWSGMDDINNRDPDLERSTSLSILYSFHCTLDLFFLPVQRVQTHRYSNQSSTIRTSSLFLFILHFVCIRVSLRHWIRKIFSLNPSDSVFRLDPVCETHFYNRGRKKNYRSTVRPRFVKFYNFLISKIKVLELKECKNDFRLNLEFHGSSNRKKKYIVFLDSSLDGHST